MPTIVSIACTPAGIDPRPEDHYARVPVETAELIEGNGIAGDRKGRFTERQLNVMARETLDTLAADGCRTEPGQMGEQLIVSGLAIDSLPAGSRIRLGDDAVIEVIKPRTGCSRLAHIQKIEIKTTRGRLGQMCRVVRGGLIRVGDPVEVLPAAERQAS